MVAVDSGMLLFKLSSFDVFPPMDQRFVSSESSDETSDSDLTHNPSLDTDSACVTKLLGRDILLA